MEIEFLVSDSAIFVAGVFPRCDPRALGGEGQKARDPSPLA